MDTNISFEPGQVRDISFGRAFYNEDNWYLTIHIVAEDSSRTNIRIPIDKKLLQGLFVDLKTKLVGIFGFLRGLARMQAAARKMGK